MQYLFDDQRAPLPRRLQQRAARRPQSSARRQSGDRAARRSQHEHAIPARPPARLRGAARRARCPTPLERLLLRQLGQRSQRAGAPAGARRTRGRATSSCSTRPITATRPRSSRSARTSSMVRVARERRRGSTSRPLPDVYRGSYKARRPRRRSAIRGSCRPRSSIGASRARRRGIARFIAETCPSVGGQIVLPPGYLAEVYGHVRAAGGVCIADEVQTAYGRMGTHFYAFEAQDVVPGHRRARQADRQRLPAWRRGHDAGDRGVVRQRHGVLQHVRRQHRLVRGRPRGARRRAARATCSEHARDVGEHTRSPGSADWPRATTLVGDVRGSGLFLGVELVTGPRDARASSPRSGLRREPHAGRRRSIGTDGPFHNVLKIRPPMPFGVTDADLLIETLDRVLDEM